MGLSNDLTLEELARLPKPRILEGGRINSIGNFKKSSSYFEMACLASLPAASFSDEIFTCCIWSCSTFHKATSLTD